MEPPGVIGACQSALSENKEHNCTFRGTMACHWGCTLKGTDFVPLTFVPLCRNFYFLYFKVISRLLNY